MDDNKIFIDNFRKYSGLLGFTLTEDGRIGVGRHPLYSYKLDIAIPSNSVSSGLHIGDGMYGFSMGNGTSSGFIPQIIGMGRDSNDPGLYFIGRAGDIEPSSTPVVVIDGRNRVNQALLDRPILGVTSNNNSEYKLLINSDGDVKCSGDVYSKDINLSKEVEMLKKEIEELKTKINLCN